MGEPFTKYAVWLKLMTGIAKNGRMIHRHQYRNKDTSKENKPFRRLVTDLSRRRNGSGGMRRHLEFRTDQAVVAQ